METNVMGIVDQMIADGVITEGPTLKAFAEVFGTNAVRLYSVAKQPKPGEVYDARVYNWDALTKFFERRLDAEAGFGTLEELVQRAVEKDAEMKAGDRRHTRPSSAKAKVDVGDGHEVPARRYDIEVGQTVNFKKDDASYVVVAVTPSHLCVQKEGTTELRALGNWTINLQMVKPE